MMLTESYKKVAQSIQLKEARTELPKATPNALKDARKSIIAQYLKLYDADKLKDTKELDKLIPERLLSNDKLNYTDMFDKMSMGELKKINKYLRSKK